LLFLYKLSTLKYQFWSFDKYRVKIKDFRSKSLSIGLSPLPVKFIFIIYSLWILYYLVSAAWIGSVVLITLAAISIVILLVDLVDTVARYKDIENIDNWEPSIFNTVWYQVLYHFVIPTLYFGFVIYELIMLQVH